MLSKSDTGTAQCSAVLHGGNKFKSYRSLRKSLGTSAGYGGHFRAVQGFKFIGESDNPRSAHHARRPTKRTYRNYEVEIKTILCTRHKSDLTPVVKITANGSQKLLLTAQFIPTANQAERYGIKMARKRIDGHDGKAKTSRP